MCKRIQWFHLYPTSWLLLPCQLPCRCKHPFMFIFFSWGFYILFDSDNSCATNIMKPSMLQFSWIVINKFYIQVAEIGVSFLHHNWLPENVSCLGYISDQSIQPFLDVAFYDHPLLNNKTSVTKPLFMMSYTWVSYIVYRIMPLSQSPCTALTAGKCKGTVTGVWRTVGIPTGHVSP